MEIFKNQISDPKQIKGLIREAHLGYLGLTEPVKMSKTVEKLIDLDIGANNFVSFIEGLPTYELPKEGAYTWAIQGIDERNYPLIKATIDSAGNTVITDALRAGYKGGVFYLWFDGSYFDATSVLSSNHPEMFSLRITGDGVRVGLTTRYEVQLLGTADSELFVPASEVEAGSKWVDNFGLVEHELSVRGSGITHSTHFELTNSTSVIRKNYEVPGNMINTGENYPLLWDFVTDEGKRFSKWLPKLDYDFFTQFRRDKARLLMYGKATTVNGSPSLIKGESGNSIKAGFGLYEQMNMGHLGYYNTFSLDDLTNFIRDITYNMLPEDKRKIVVSTGEYGAGLFHTAAMNKGASYSWGNSSHNFKMEGGKMILNEGQMVGYNFINGIEIRLVIDKMKDNTIHNVMTHPSGGPITSYIFDIFDFGTTNGKPNIQRLKVKDYEELFGYIAGMRDPYSPYNNLSSPRFMASSKDGYSVFKQWCGGVHVGNPLRTGRFIPTLYQV